MATVATGGYSAAPGAGQGRPRNPFGLPTTAGPLRGSATGPLDVKNPVTTHTQTGAPSAPSPAVLPMPPAAPTAPTAPGVTAAAIANPGVTPYNPGQDPALQQTYAFANSLYNPAAGAAASASAANPYDISANPGLLMAEADAQKSNAAAQAQALSDEAQLVEQAGIPSLAAAMGLDSNVATIAQNNKFSDAANLLYNENTANTASNQSYQRNTQDLGVQNTAALKQLVNNLVAANEVFSGYGNEQKQLQSNAYNTAMQRESQDLATALGANTHTYQQGLSDLTAQVQQQIGSIDQALQQTEDQNQMTVMQAMEQAYQDYIGWLLQHPPDGGPGGPGGGAGGNNANDYYINGVGVPLSAAMASGAPGGPGPQL